MFYYSVANLQKQRTSQLERTRLTGDIGGKQKLEKTVGNSFADIRSNNPLGANQT